MRRTSKKFAPYRDQIDCAKRRILGYLEREQGAVQMGSATDARTLHRHITQPRDLGRTFDQQCATLKKALGELMAERKITWDDSEHMLSVTYAVPRRRESSSRRYAHRRTHRAFA